MRKLSTFTFMTINGYSKGPNEDISWHKHGGEESEYSAESLKSENVLLFGRVAYEMMASFWPTPKGTSIFDNIKHVLNLNLVNAMTFKSGIVLLRYQPVTESGNHI
jgi:dihydrofolate reductase